MTAPDRPRFSVADDPWIETRGPAGYDRLGLRAAFLDAHLIADLAVPIPPAASVLLRLMTAMTARITGLDDADLTATEWNARRRDALTRPNGFDANAVHAYFDNDQYCFDVFDPVRPWLQDAALREQCPAPSGINSLVFGRPAGNNLAWLSPHHDQDPQPLPTGQALQHLLIHRSYGSSGGCGSRTVGAVTAFRARTGPLRATVSFHPLGRTLHETLIASIPKFTGDEQTLPDACPWEDPQPPDPTRAEPVTWPGRLLTGRARHTLLLTPAPDGRTVTDAYLTWSTQLPIVQATDPYVIIDSDPRKPPQRRLTQRRADADRAWWRELDALLLARDEHHTTRRTARRPEIFDTLNDLPPDLRRRLRVRVHGFDQDSKTIQRRWYTAMTPPILAWAQEHDPERAMRIGECCRHAEATAARLTFLAGQAWQQTTLQSSANTKTSSPRGKSAGEWAARARKLYWEGAEAVFWRLLDEPDTPARDAFARTAATALRTVTAHARFRQPAAARAVAEAIGALYRPAPTRAVRADAEGGPL